MEINYQLDEWVKGNPIHNKERDECCPDFSCCIGNIADEDIRKRFSKAYYENDESTKNEMLGMFLGNAIANYSPNKNVYIAGMEPNKGGNV